MFGRIRASPSPAEYLETEIPPSKLFNDRSLSIYEATLLKLKQGAQRSFYSDHNLSPVSQISMDFESNGDVSEVSPQVSDSCSKQGSPTCSSPSICSSLDQVHKKGREISIHVLFSRYNNSHQKQDVPSLNHGMIVENCTSMGSSVSSCDSESTSN